LIVLDATVLIAHQAPDDRHCDAGKASLSEIADPRCGASSLTLAEVAPARTSRLADAQAALQALGVAELRLPEDAAKRLAALRAATELKLRDCCVLLAAEDGPGTILTLDDRLARAATRLGLGS
jgi:predicted nucleic acid-binding protein